MLHFSKFESLTPVKDTSKSKLFETRSVQYGHRYLRLACNMTCLGHTVTLTWRDLSSNFKIDISRIKKHMDRSGLTRGTWSCQYYYLSLSSWEVIHEKHFPQNVFFPFGDLLHGRRHRGGGDGGTGPPQTFQHLALYLWRGRCMEIIDFKWSSSPQSSRRGAAFDLLYLQY